MKRYLLLAFFLVLSAVGLGRAEPSPSIRWLMNEPATLFDISILKLRMENKQGWTPKLMEELEGGGLHLRSIGVGNVVYDENKDTMTISVPLVGKSSEKLCNETLTKYRHIISPYPSTSESRYSFLAMDFAYKNYMNQSRLRALAKNMSRLIVFQVEISETEASKEKTVYCSTRLDPDIPSSVGNE